MTNEQPKPSPPQAKVDQEALVPESASQEPIGEDARPALYSIDGGKSDEAVAAQYVPSDPGIEAPTKKLEALEGGGESHSVGIFSGMSGPEARWLKFGVTATVALGAAWLVFVAKSQQDQGTNEAVQSALKKDAKQAQVYVKKAAEAGTVTFTPTTGDGVGDIIEDMYPDANFNPATKAAVVDYLGEHGLSDNGGPRNDKEVTMPIIETDAKTGEPLPVEVDGKKFGPPTTPEAPAG